MSTTKKRQEVGKADSRLSLHRQCELLSIHRSSLYYKPVGESALNLELMKEIDKWFTKYPDYGVYRMTQYLNRDLGYAVNEKRIRRLYNLMGLQTIYRAARTTIRNQAEYKFPYLLKNLDINKPNQVWQTDITYIPMKNGFMYLTAIIDVYSRKIMSWSLSNSMTKEWVCELVETAIGSHGKPDIINTDQGSQYTSELFVNLIKNNEIKLSMDGKGRALDNIYIERFWRSIKYEKIFLNPCDNGLDLYHLIDEYMEFYNSKRRHTKVDDQTPNYMFYESDLVS